LRRTLLRSVRYSAFIEAVVVREERCQSNKVKNISMPKAAATCGCLYFLKRKLSKFQILLSFTTRAKNAEKRPRSKNEGKIYPR